MPKLVEAYEKNKGTKDEFEVVYVSLDCEESSSSFRKGIQEMPWLVHAYMPAFAVSLCEKIFNRRPKLPAIAAFNDAGNLETKAYNLAFKDEWNSSFPFIGNDMSKLVCKELINKYKWNLRSFYFPNANPDSDPFYDSSSDSDSDLDSDPDSDLGLDSDPDAAIDWDAPLDD